MKVTFIGAAHEVTGSCTMLEVNGRHILVDCGMEQGVDLFENIEIPVSPSEIDAIVATHAHIDHTGKFPFLVAHGYKGPIYSTAATAHLCKIMLLDSAHIQEFEAQWRNRKGKRSGKEEFVPLYTTDDAMRTMELFSTAGYGQDIELFDGVKIRFSDAGHLLGSSSVLFTLKEDGEERTILFSGDIGNLNKPIIRNPQQPPHADYVVVESTYGDRLHSPSPDYIGELTEIIQKTLDRGGNVVIPSFAVGRTQELLYYIRIIKEQGLVKNHDGFKVIVDSPLAVEATNIYSSEMNEYYDEETVELINRGINPVLFPDLRVSVSSDESKAINDDPEPKVIISASGMCEAGRIRHHLKHNLWRPECTILFVGYQSRETVGAKLLEGAEIVKLFGEEIKVGAEIRKIDAFSSHADQKMLLNWVSDADPGTRLFVNHGEDKVTEFFADEASKFTGCQSTAPFSGEVWDLISDELVQKAVVVPVIRKQAQGGIEVISVDNDGRLITGPLDGKNRQWKTTGSTAKAGSVYADLCRSGSRLMEVIRECQGRSNKQIKKLTKEINKLIESCGNWEE
jgi:metallo-beta-lactamase family protein